MKKALISGVSLASLIALSLLFWAGNRSPIVQKREAKTAETVGAPSAQTVVMKDLQGNDVRLADYKGRAVLVNFWATWCTPCLIEIPWMMEFQKKYGSRGFIVLGVSMDEDGKQAVSSFLAKTQFDLDGQKQAVNYPILLGNNVITSQLGGILGLPTTMLFSRDGRKVKTITGLVSHDDVVKSIEGQL